jgi:hypothetical protein
MAAMNSTKRNAIKKALLESLDKGATVTAACESAGIARKTFYEWLKEDLNFCNEISHSQQGAILTVEDALYRNATQGGKGFGDTTAQIFFLCNREPDRWKNVNRVEVENKEVKDFGSEISRKQAYETFRKKYFKKKGK